VEASETLVHKFCDVDVFSIFCRSYSANKLQSF